LLPRPYTSTKKNTTSAAKPTAKLTTEAKLRPTAEPRVEFNPLCVARNAPATAAHTHPATYSAAALEPRPRDVICQYSAQ
jgi:hypothetical protein